MNLNINEIENRILYPNKTQTQTQTQTQPRKLEKGKKKVTYDDILSSLKMQVVNGKLQIVRKDELNDEDEPVKKHVSFSPQTTQNSQFKMAPKTLKNRHLPIPQEYFEEEVRQVPMTRQEAIIQLLKARKEDALINQSKSRKLLFSTNNINVAPTYAPAMSNMFFKLK